MDEDRLEVFPNRSGGQGGGFNDIGLDQYYTVDIYLAHTDILVVANYLSVLSNWIFVSA